LGCRMYKGGGTYRFGIQDSFFHSAKITLILIISTRKAV
jgi:hypothetical protein